MCSFFFWSHIMQTFSQNFGLVFDFCFFQNKRRLLTYSTVWHSKLWIHCGSQCMLHIWNSMWVLWNACREREFIYSLFHIHKIHHTIVENLNVRGKPAQSIGNKEIVIKSWYLSLQIAAFKDMRAFIYVVLDFLGDTVTT